MADSASLSDCRRSTIHKSVEWRQSHADLGKDLLYNKKSGGAVSRSTIAYRIHNTLSRINDLPEKDDLRQWSPKARRNLRLVGDVSLIVSQKGTDIDNGVETFTVPKLALMVASPTLRELILHEPEVLEISLEGSNFEPTAVGILCYWLTSICNWNAQALPYLPCPDDIFRALELRHAAQILCMDKYVRSFEIRYFLDIQSRVPCLLEAVAVSSYALDVGDPVLNAWASRVGHLRRTSSLHQEYLEKLDDILAMNQHQRLLEALDAADVVADGNSDVEHCHGANSQSMG